MATPGDDATPSQRGEGVGDGPRRSLDAKAQAQLTETAYQHLRAIAGKQMAGERANHTLQPTALVSEAILRMRGTGEGLTPADPAFYWAAAEAMRRVLIDHARARNTLKRGGGARREVLDWSGAIASAAELAERAEVEDFDDLDAALKSLDVEDPRSGQVVRLRVFAGLTTEQVANVLGVSLRTANRDWTFGRVALLERLKAGRSTDA